MSFSLAGMGIKSMQTKDEETGEIVVIHIPPPKKKKPEQKVPQVQAPAPLQARDPRQFDSYGRPHYPGTH